MYRTQQTAQQTTALETSMPLRNHADDSRMVFGWIIACLIAIGLLGKVATADDLSSADPLSHGKLTRLDLDDFRGRRWQMEDVQDDKLVVVAFLGTECPLAKLYATRLQKLQAEYGDRGVQVVGVMSNRHDSLLDIQAFARRQSLTFPMLKDAGGRLADDLNAKRTPEVFVFDQSRNLRYRGRVDDQYGIGYVRDEPRRHDLRIALDSLLAGTPVEVASTDAAGCIIGRSKTVDTESAVTYGGQIAKLLSKHCVECHREGEIAPFALTDYEEVAGWADMIAEVVRDKRMPPWHADPQHGHFSNARLMSDEEKQLLYDWAEAGAPAGDLSDLPELPETVTDWQLPREPDFKRFISEKPFEVPAEGAVRYQYFKLDPGFEKDMWIEAAELKPGNRAVVHHILAFAAPKGQRRGLNGARGFLIGYVPGARVHSWPKGHGKKIPAGSELIFQVHYTPVGTEQLDHSEIGICFRDASEIEREIVTTSAATNRFVIEPYAEAQPVEARGDAFPKGAKLLSMSPHMHVRGKAFEYKLASNDKVLLDIPEYDFNWQTTYVLDEPMPLEQGDRILCTAYYDNSEKNLNNPAPEKSVRWGDQTWDEMMIGYYHLSVPLKRPGAEWSMRKRMVMREFERLDSDDDNRLIRANITERGVLRVFDQLDADRDKILTRKEVEDADF